MAFSPLYYHKKSIFEIQNQKKDLEKKVENFGAIARTSYVKEMTVAGLKMNFLKFWKGQNVGLYEDYHLSENLSYIPTLRGPICNLRRIILPCFLCCNASHPILSAYLLHLVRCPTQFAIFCHSSCSCLDVNMCQNIKLCRASDKMRQICAQDRV